jgi:hypothetical protein
MPDVSLPSNLEESISRIAEPVLKHLEPYKTHSYTRERGVPQLHDDYGKYSLLNVFTHANLDCDKQPDDALCLHELKDSKIKGAGHHARAKTNVPIIGILTQPIPSPLHGDHPQWENEYNRVRKEELNRLQKEDPTWTEDETLPKK